MTEAERRNCPTCGEEVPAGEIRCPNGHLSVWPPDEAAGADSSEIDLDGVDLEAAVPTPVPPRKSADSLFECRRCERLVETQAHKGKITVPRFCPWCGDPVSSLIGRELDGYRLDKVIGSGGFGVVYLASNVAESTMKAVVKFLRPALTYFEPQLIRIFVEEARFTESVGQTCWNVVRVFNVREKPWPYFFMEYVRGRTLEEFIRDVRPETVPLPDGIAYLQGIAKGLAATHRRGRIHRDLKPLNLLVIRSKGVRNPEDRVKMVDFGLAMRIASVGAGLSNMSGTTRGSRDPGESPVQTAGTPEYMPPEAFDGVNQLEGDVYSFGITAYELLTGQKPWGDPPEGVNRLSYWRDCHQTKLPRPVREVRPEIPKRVARVIMECLEKEPARRIPSAEELLTRLREPLSRWWWAGLAAATLLLVLLVWQHFFSAVEPRVEEWMVRGRPLPVPGTLHVRNADDLSMRVVGVRFDGEITGLTWSAWRDGESFKGLRFEFDSVDRRKLSIRFREPSAIRKLLGSTLRIEGRKTALLEAVRASGEIVIVEDVDAPRVSDELEYTCASSEDPQRLPASPRLHPRDVKLVAQVFDEHVDPSGVCLHVTAPRASTIKGERLKSDETRWSFSLSSLDPGRPYRGYVEARDLAGNIAAGDGSSFEFFVDDRVEITVFSETARLAEDKIFFEFELAEDVRNILARVGSETVRPEFYSAEGVDSPVDLVGSRLQAVPFLRLERDRRLLLALPASPGESASLEVRDTALCDPNHLPVLLAWKRPGPLSLNAIRSISIDVSGMDQPLVVNPRKYLKDDSPEVLRFFVPETTETVGATLRFEFEPGKILKAECSADRERVKGTVSSSSVVFENVELRRDVNNGLSIRIFDPLDRATEGELVLHPDGFPPEFQILQRSKGKEIPRNGYHDVETGGGISLHVKSEELLAAVFASMKGKELKLVSFRGGDKPSRAFSLESLEAFELTEGTHTVSVRAVDLVGHEKAQQSPVVLNSAAPELEQAEKKLELGRKDHHDFRVTDQNGVDLDRGNFFVLLEGEAKPRPALMKPVARSGSSGRLATSVTFRVDLDWLPDSCSGWFIHEIPDAGGRRSKGRLEFEFRRVGWNEEVSWRGLTWIRCFRGDGSIFYITRTEISNEVFRHPAILRNGTYVDPKLRELGYMRPFFWSESGEFPGYVVPGKNVSAGQFPVVGVSPYEAGRFAEVVFGARLPTKDEWLSAARMANLDGRFPWKDAERGRHWINHRQSGGDPESALRGHRAEKMIWKGREYPYWNPTWVSFDPFPPSERQRLNFCRVLHLMGNVSELVLLKGKRGSSPRYGVVGGDFDLNFEKFDLRHAPRPYNELDREFPKTGFRLVIELKKADPDFRKQARKD